MSQVYVVARRSGQAAHHINRGADCSPAGPATEWGGWVQVKLQLSRVAIGSAVTLSLVGGSLLAAPEAMAQCVTGYDDKGEPVVAPAAVMITWPRKTISISARRFPHVAATLTRLFANADLELARMKAGERTP